MYACIHVGLDKLYTRTSYTYTYSRNIVECDVLWPEGTKGPMNSAIKTQGLWNISLRLTRACLPGWERGPESGVINMARLYGVLWSRSPYPI